MWQFADMLAYVTAVAPERRHRPQDASVVRQGLGKEIRHAAYSLSFRRGHPGFSVASMQLASIPCPALRSAMPLPELSSLLVSKLVKAGDEFADGGEFPGVVPGAHVGDPTPDRLEQRNNLAFDPFGQRLDNNPPPVVRDPWRDARILPSPAGR